MVRSYSPHGKVMGRCEPPVCPRDRSGEKERLRLCQRCSFCPCHVRHAGNRGVVLRTVTAETYRAFLAFPNGAALGAVGYSQLLWSSRSMINIWGIPC